MAEAEYVIIVVLIDVVGRDTNASTFRNRLYYRPCMLKKFREDITGDKENVRRHPWSIINDP